MATIIPNIVTWSIVPQKGTVTFYDDMNVWLGETNTVVDSWNTSLNATNIVNQEINDIYDQIRNADPTSGYSQAYIDENYTKSLDTLADLRALNIVYGSVKLSGYHTKNDGAFGDTFYRLKGLKTSEVDNGGTIIVVDIASIEYVYELQYNGAVNIKWFGAKGDGIFDDTTAIEKSINSLANGGKVINPNGDYLVTRGLNVTYSKLEIEWETGANIIVDSTFTDSSVFTIGTGSYIVDGKITNPNIDFSNCTNNVDAFNCNFIARWVFRDVDLYDLVGTTFTETSVGHEITCENVTATSADVLNGVGIYVKFTDSYFTNLKAIGFSEYGIVNDGNDNRFYGCHPWSYPRSQQGYTNFTTKILFWDKEDGMWDSCYADTFEREDAGLPPSFSNGGIGYYFSKVSGNATMTNCGFYSLDADVDSVIGVEASSDIQQLNLVNCRIVGANPTAYEQFAKRNTSSTALNLVGCNFSEFVYQAKEALFWSDVVAGNQIYNRFLDNTEFSSLETALKTFKDRRETYSTIVFKDETTGIDPYYWDYRTNKLERLLRSEDWISPTLLNSWVNSGGGAVITQYKKDSDGRVHIKGYVKDGVTTLGASIFNLPVGYRPSEVYGFAQICGASYNQQASIGVNTTGNVYVLSCPSNVNVTLNFSFDPA